MHRLEHPADRRGRGSDTAVVSKISTTVTSHAEHDRSEAATSAPMKPMPTQTTRAPWPTASGCDRHRRRVAEIEHAGEPGARRIEAPVAAPGGDQQPVEGDALAAREDDLALAPSIWDGPRAEPRVDVLLGVPLGRSHEGVAPAAARRAGTPSTAADARRAATVSAPIRTIRPSKPFAAQRGRRGGPREAAPTMTNVAVVGTPLKPRSAARRPRRDREGRDRLVAGPSTTAPVVMSKCCRGTRRSIEEPSISPPFARLQPRCVQMSLNANSVPSSERRRSPHRRRRTALASPSGTSSAEPTVMNSAMPTSSAARRPAPARTALQLSRLSPGVSSPERRSAVHGRYGPSERRRRPPGSGSPERKSIGRSAGMKAPATHASWNSTS